MRRANQAGLAILAMITGFMLVMGGCSSTPTVTDDEEPQEEVAAQPTLDDSESIPVGDSPIYGNPDAPVTIVEFSSMQCPHCARADQTLKELVERYPDEVRVVFKHFPLGMQQQAKPASKAVAAAHRQEMAYEMKSALFARLRDYSSMGIEELGAEIAGQLDMDVEQFRADFNDPEIEAIVDADMKLGARLGVRGTPHFFVNGAVVNGAQPLERFAEIVDDQLRVVRELEADGIAPDQIYAAAVDESFDSDGAPSPAAEPTPEPEVKVFPMEIHDDDPAKGASAEDALVTIVEFSSFQCPFCARASGTLQTLVERYPDQVRVVFKHFPLPFQEQSEPASRASIAAANQGQFWEMYELLYENQSELGDELFEELATELELDMEQFRADLEAPETAERVSQAQSEGRAAGIRGTPGFLVNGVQVTGAQPLDVFENHVKEQIEIAEEIRGEQDLTGNALHDAVIDHNIEHAATEPQPQPQPQPSPQPEEPTVLDADALSIGNSYTRGAEDAPVTIYEFSSFQCPFCARGADTMEQVLDEYDGQVRLVFKNFPLPFQEYSEPAARAALAAGEQGKFWEMYEQLYENQQRFGEDGIFGELAENIGLDPDRFGTDFESDAIAEQVEADQTEGQSVGVRGTPGYFINGENVSGAQPIENFREVIDRHLED